MVAIARTLSEDRVKAGPESLRSCASSSGDFTGTAGVVGARTAGASSAGRSQALGQLGMHGLRRPDPAPAYAPPAAQATQTTRGDWMFIAAMGAMLAVLGVLIYLIMTLE